MAHTYTNLLTHIIFSTKDRKPTLAPDLKQRLFPYLGGIFRELDASPMLVNGPREISVGVNERFRKAFLSPLPGLGLYPTYDFYPRLTPWATICRRYAANTTRSIIK